MSKSPIILAIDTPDISRCRELMSATEDYVGVYKLGLEFFVANGKEGISQLLNEFPKMELFLDLKLHDIPNTVGKAATSLNELRIEFLTVHASGGAEMVKSAVSALPNTRITAVTVLTSLDGPTLEGLGITGSLGEIVLKSALIAVKSGARAIVASPLEVAMLRRNLPKDVLLITPGIRTEPTADDQKRTMSPQEALEGGSDFLVIGRPITAACDPKSAAREIFESL